MELARKLIKIEIICLEIDKSKNISDLDYMNILVDDLFSIPFIFISDSDFSLDMKLRTLYNEWIRLDFDWTTKYLADIILSDDILSIRYVVRIPKVSNSVLKGKMITTYDFLKNKGDDKYDRIISG